MHSIIIITNESQINQLKKQRTHNKRNYELYTKKSRKRSIIKRFHAEYFPGIKKDRKDYLNIGT